MKGIRPCWAVVRVRVNERAHAGVNGSRTGKQMTGEDYVLKGAQKAKGVLTGYGPCLLDRDGI